VSFFADILPACAVHLFKEATSFPIFISCLASSFFPSSIPYLQSSLHSFLFHFPAILFLRPTAFMYRTTSFLSLLHVKRIFIVTRSVCVFPAIHFLYEPSHICVHTYIHMPSRTDTHTHTHTHTSQFIRNYIHTYIHMHNTYIHTYVRTYIHTYIHTHIHTYIQMPSCAHTHTHTSQFIRNYRTVWAISV
jgi:uncharacterized membrane protein YjjB (DUF3815 family)